jgi:hypothetical protein
MSRFKDFGKTVDLDKPAEPLSFKLWEEEFHCVKRIQGRVMLELVESSNADDPSASARTIRTFFKKVMLPESYERFDVLLGDQEKIVSVETLSEIVAWLIEQYGDRPNPQPGA